MFHMIPVKLTDCENLHLTSGDFSFAFLLHCFISRHQLLISGRLWNTGLCAASRLISQVKTRHAGLHSYHSPLRGPLRLHRQLEDPSLSEPRSIEQLTYKTMLLASKVASLSLLNVSRFYETVWTPADCDGSQNNLKATFCNFMNFWGPRIVI